MAFSFSRAYKPLYGLLAGVFIASISTGIFFVSGEITVSRIDYEKTISDYRIPLYQISLQALEKRPYLGYGYGAYEEIIPAFSNQEANKYVRAAHNTYLENAIELGLVGACSLFLSIGMLVLICVRKVLERSSNTIYPCVGLGVTALLGAHSLVDFPLQMPAIAMTYAAIMGASCAQSSRHKMKKERGAKGGQRPRRRRINDLPVNRF